MSWAPVAGLFMRAGIGLLLDGLAFGIAAVWTGLPIPGHMDASRRVW